MDKLQQFRERRSRGEVTLMATAAAILLFAMGIRFGELLAGVSSAA